MAETQRHGLRATAVLVRRRLFILSQQTKTVSREGICSSPPV